MSITQRDQLLTLALRSARVVPAGQTPRAVDLALAADYFNLEILSLQARSDLLKTIPRKTLTLVSGTAEYTLPSDTIDVKVGPNDEIGTITPSSGNETQVFSMSRAEYASVSNKAASGRPTRAYIEKADTIKILLWPTPDTDAVTLNYSQIRVMTEADTGAASIDLRRAWFRAVMLAVAAECARAKSMGLDLVGSLRGDAEAAYRDLRANDQQRGSLQFTVSHNARRW